MWLPSTWTCFWLLLMPSLIGYGSSDMFCYHCRDEVECKNASRPFNIMPCTDPLAVCLLLLGEYGRSVEDRRRVWYRGCAHPEWVAEFGGAPDTCTRNNEGWKVSNAASNWIKGHPTKHTGGTQTFPAESALDWEVCSCSAKDKCNDVMGKVGEPYPPPPKSPNNNNACVCDDNENNCPDKKGKGKGNGSNGNGNGNGGKSGSGVAHHFKSAVALGGVIILSVWRVV